MPTDRDLNTAMTSMFQALAKEVRDGSVAVATFGEQMKSLTTSVDRLTSIVHAGNGSSLVTKVAVIEDQISEIDSKITGKVTSIIDQKFNEFKDKNDEYKKENIKTHRESKYLKWTLYGAVIPGVLALVLGIIQLVY